MSSNKEKKPAGAGKGKKAPRAGVEKDGDEVLQAVILADSFQTRFKPLTIDTPRCLLPLANVPLIEYTLEFLHMNGVQYVFIYCGNHTEMVESYIAESRWSRESKTSPFSVLSFIRLAGANSIGDVLRDLDKRSVIGGDFILVHGDVVSNLDLEPILISHKERRKASADNIMTMVLMEAGLKEHRTKAKGITPIFVVDTKTKRCLHYEETSPLSSDRYMVLDPTVLELSTDFEIRSDLIDPGIDICTPEALALWSDSFDYELPRRNFLNGVLKDWELNGKSIYAEILGNGYAARANNLAMYESVSKDILLRWPCPFVPDCNVFPGQDYTIDVITGNSFDKDVQVGRGSRVRRSILANGSRVGEGSKVFNSIIGPGCTIGKNVTVSESFIWAGTTVRDNVTISRSILAGKGMKVGSGCTVQPGCVMSFGVILDNGVTVPENSLISKLDDAGSQLPTNKGLVGPAGDGAAFTDPELDDLDERDPARLQHNLLYSLEGFNLSTSTISTLASEPESDDEDQTLQSPGTLETSRSRLSSFASDASGSQNFVADAATGLLEALRDETGDFDSAKMEFLGLRLSSDASENAIRKAVALAFARRASELLSEGLVPNKAAEEALKGCKGAARFIDEVAVAGGDAEQVEFALALQKSFVGIKGLEPSRAGLLLSAMFQQLYALEVLEEDGIMSWWADERASGGGSIEVVRSKCKALVEWLENADSDEDDDDDDDDDDE